MLLRPGRGTALRHEPGAVRDRKPGNDPERPRDDAARDPCPRDEPAASGKDLLGRDEEAAEGADREPAIRGAEDAPAVGCRSAITSGVHQSHADGGRGYPTGADPHFA